jgi:hypothetical protein
MDGAWCANTAGHNRVIGATRTTNLALPDGSGEILQHLCGI